MLRLSSVLRMNLLALSILLLGTWLPRSSAQSGAAASRPWMNASLSPDERAALVLKEMTLDEKISLLHGTGMIDLTTGKIDAIFVHPAYMKRGIGTGMVRYLEALARSHGLPKLRLESTLNAAPFYRSLGFEGDEIAQYRSPRGLTMDCVPMTKRLGG